MKRLYDFQCNTCQTITEEYTEYKQTSICPSCGNEAKKLISKPTIQLEGVTGSFPGAALSWERKHKQSAKEY